MPILGFTAEASLYETSDAYRSGGGRVSAMAGVQPALQFSCHCNGPDKSINWSCTCRFWGGGCWGYSTSYADGSSEWGGGCDARTE